METYEVSNDEYDLPEFETASTPADVPDVRPQFQIDAKLTDAEKALLRLSSLQEQENYAPDIGLSPVLFSQVSLPHAAPPKNPEIWSRTNGRVTMKVLPKLVQDPVTGDIQRQYPFGVYPRLIIAYMTTVAATSQSRVVPLGDNLSAFIQTLNLTRGGSTYKNMRSQMSRLFGSSIRFEGVEKSDQGEQRSEVFFTFADAHHEFIPRPGAERGGSGEWLNEVVLSERFYQEITTRRIPIDLNVVRELPTAMTIDVYLWATHRGPNVKNGPARIKWTDLAMQFGAGFSDVRRFRRHFKEALDLVSKVYPGLRYDSSRNDYIMLYHSVPSIARNAKSIENLKRFNAPAVEAGTWYEPSDQQ